MAERWAAEQVFALAPKPSSLVAAQPLAVPTRWTDMGCDSRAVWGRCRGSGSEPYETVVDHVGVAFRCTCPSRVFPCKHAVALLLLWVRGQVPEGAAPAGAAAWIAKRLSAEAVSPPEHAEPSGDTTAGVDTTPPVTQAPSTTRDDRVARMQAGLAELQRWLADRVRAGLADPALARYAMWDELAARLVDAQIGGLANRVRRLAGAVGASPEWHEHVLAEFGVLHLLASGGQHLRRLPPALADSVAVALGWQVRQADVLAGVPDTDQWQVLGRSDVREDRIEVRRHWLRGAATGRWAMLLSFAAYGQGLDTSLPVGTTVHADLFRYPGALGLRALLGARHAAPQPGQPPPQATVAEACAEVGGAVAVEPWIERCPAVVTAAPTRSGGQWVLSDHTGSAPMAAATSLGRLLACSAGGAVTMTCEWTADGFLPLTVHLADRAVDIGPTADPSFVSAA
jgi:SWIM zinc finger